MKNERTISRAKNALKRVMSRHELSEMAQDSGRTTIDVVKMTEVSGGGYGPDGIMLKNGRILVFHHGRLIDNIDGIVGGYNLYALDAVQVLSDLEIIPQGVADAFKEWFRKEDRRRQEASALRELRTQALEKGFKLEKVR